MKLLQKTSRVYFVVSAFLLLVTGVLLYFFLTTIIEEETKEQLLANEMRIASRLSHHQPTTQLAPVIEITKLEKVLLENISIVDTTLFDDKEQEFERFLQVSSIRNVNGTSYRIILRQMMEEPIGYIGSIGLALGITFLFLLLSTTFINRLVFSKLWQPFYNSLAALINFSVNQPKTLKLDKSDIAEFEELNAAILTLTEKTRQDYRVLKEFTENASHEMQTPLAVIQTKLDELLQTPSLTESQAGQIRVAVSSVQKLTRLNHALILLTKIENQQFQHKELINVSQVISEHLKQLEDFIQAKNLKVEFETTARITVNSDPALVEMLVSNLLSNAIKYNLPGGEINILLTANSLEIANTGESLLIAPELLFDRFSKANQTTASLGLGLAIVKSICDQQGWKITYNADKNLHRIKVNFREENTG